MIACSFGDGMSCLLTSDIIFTGFLYYTCADVLYSVCVNVYSEICKTRQFTAGWSTTGEYLAIVLGRSI